MILFINWISSGFSSLQYIFNGNMQDLSQALGSVYFILSVTSLGARQGGLSLHFLIFLNLAKNFHTLEHMELDFLHFILSFAAYIYILDKQPR